MNYNVCQVPLALGITGLMAMNWMNGSGKAYRKRLRDTFSLQTSEDLGTAYV